MYKYQQLYITKIYAYNLLDNSLPWSLWIALRTPNVKSSKRSIPIQGGIDRLQLQICSSSRQ